MNDGLKTFARAVWWGALIGGGPYLLLTVPAALPILADPSSSGLSGALVLVALPILLAGAGTLTGAVLFGLPLTVLLRHMRKETSANYGMVGALLGFTMPALAAFATFGPELGGSFLMFAIPGLLAGTTAATTWGNRREQVALAAREEAEAPRPDRGERWLR